MALTSNFTAYKKKGGLTGNMVAYEAPKKTQAVELFRKPVANEQFRSTPKLVTPTVTPLNTLGPMRTSTPQTAGRVFNPVQDIAVGVIQGTAQAYGAAGQVVLNAATLGKAGPLIPKGKLGRALYGTNNPIKLAEQQPFVKSSSKLAIPLAIGMLATDLIGAGSAKYVYKAIAQVDNVADATKLATKLKIPKELIPKAADLFVKAKNVDEAEKAFKAVTAFSKVPIKPLSKATQEADTLVKTNLKGLVNEYVKKFDNVINTDDARELFPAYRGNRALSADVHESASTVAKATYDHLLDTRKGVGNNTVLFTAGGTGVGKTSAVNSLGNIKEFPIIYDTNMAAVESAAKKIDQALSKGYNAEINFIYNDIKTSLSNALKRASGMEAKLGSGRTVPLAEHIKTHVNSPKTYLDLYRKYADNPKVSFVAIDNTGNITKKIDNPIEFIAKRLYNETNDGKLAKQLEQQIDEAFKTGRISDTTRTGFLGAKEHAQTGLQAGTGARLADGGGASKAAEVTTAPLRPATNALGETSLAAKTPPPSTPVPPKTGTKPSPSSGVGSTFNKIKTNILEYVQNTEERIRQLQKRPDIKIDDATDIYQKMTLMPGRISARVEKGYTKAKDIADDIVSLSGRTKSNVKSLRAEVNTYLQALHAPERNAALGDGAAGMLTDDALRITKAATPEVKAIANKALDLNKQTLKLLNEAGVISDDFLTTLTTKYKNHVPLQRVMDEADDIGEILSGRGFDVTSTGIKRAKGSSREVHDILDNIMLNYEQAVIRAEKNIVDNTTLAFVRKNKDVLDDLMVEYHPKALGKSFKGEGMVMEHTNDPTILRMFDKGKPVWVKIKDPQLAIALRGVGREKLGTLLSSVGSITRLYSSLATRFNPEFALPNKIRDLQETMTFLASQGDVGFKGAVKTSLRDPVSIKSVLDALRGADTPGAKLYREMVDAGGTTGGMALSTRKQVGINIDKLFATARSNPKKVAQKLVEYVDNFNTIFEDSTRLSVYKTALGRGLSTDRAAFLAKEASINFNRMGKGGPVINALYMFANASIQGSTKMIRAMAKPKVAAAVVATVGGSVAAVNQWNDQVDPDWRDKVTKWDRMNGLTIMLPSEEGAKYFTIPVSWGIKPILVMANGAYDAVAGIGDFDPAKLTKDVLSAFLNAYNPVGGTDVASALVPTIADMPVDIARNQSWSGSKIRPDWDQNAPKDIQYFDSLEETAQGRAIIDTTKKIQESTGIVLSPANINYAVDQVVGGAGRSIKKTFNSILGLFSEKPLPIDEYPFISRFYRERTDEETGNTATAGMAQELKIIKSQQSRDSFYRTKEAEKIHKEFKSLPPEEANARYKILKETNPLVAEKVKSIAKDEKKGLTPVERSIKSLYVQSGERAQYIYAELEKLGNDKDAKNALYKEWKAKGLISDEVAKQLRALIKSGGKLK